MQAIHPVYCQLVTLFAGVSIYRLLGRSRWCNRLVEYAGVLLVLGAVCGRSGQAQEQQQPPWHQFFEQQVVRLQEATLKDLEAVTPENWEKLKRRWRRQLMQMLGVDHWMRQDRPDLHAKVVGTIELDSVVVERLHYQSLPGLYVTANLYRPKGRPEPSGWPAVLYVCGHARVTDYGRQLGNKTNYQHHGLWLARHGVVCLMIDTIQLGEFHGAHHGTYRLGRWDWISRGFTPAGVETWNAIRGIDLLCQRPDVDAHRIGITGRSGGGAYSWFAAALDERIGVAVPVAGITDLRNHVLDGCVEGHCDCMYFVNYYGWDYAKLAALVAPRPLLLENTDADGIFPLDGVMRIDRQLRQLYARLGAADRYGVVITPGPHADSQSLRVPAFDWLTKHLGVPQQVIEPPAKKEIDPLDLLVFTHETPRDERVTSVSGWFVPSATPDSDAGSGASLGRGEPPEWQAWITQLQRWRVLPRQVVSPEMSVVAEGDHEAWHWRWLEEHTGTAPMHLLEVVPGGDAAQPSSSAGTLVHLVLSCSQPLDQGVNSLLQDQGVAQRLAQFADRRHVFVLWGGADWLSRLGSVVARRQLVRRFYLLGSSPESVATTDLARALTWLVAHHAGEELEVMATGREVVAAMLAILLLKQQGDDAGPRLRLTLGNVPHDPLLTACIPGLWRVTSVRQLLAATEQVVDVMQGEELAALGPKLLVDPAAYPQQANGIRIVEVGPQSASVWVRATLWPRPNLADLPDVEFAEPAGRGRQNRKPILPELGVAGLRYAAPGTEAEVRVGFRAAGTATWTYTPWQPVTAQSDYSRIVRLENLEPGRQYSLRSQVRAPGTESASNTFSASFRTLPDPRKPARFRLAVTTGQAFPDRDGPFGFNAYRSMQRRGTDGMIMTGDVVYYDRLARSAELAYYHWQRTYGLDTLIDFHRHVPTWFIKDDHDTYVNDCWPGQKLEWTEEFTFEIGQRIFRQETGLPSPPYRTFLIGNDLQIWLMEGRDYRSPNPEPDGPEKTIWGAEQKRWLSRTLNESTARFKVVVSPTPLVGPDRDNKADNHANRAFATEGREVRRMLANHPHTISVCGDRHWQYHSVDPETGLHEFSCGPLSDRHAGGWRQEDYRPEYHRFLRVGGGYLELELDGEGENRRLTLRHLGTDGQEYYRYDLTDHAGSDSKTDN